MSHSVRAGSVNADILNINTCIYTDKFDALQEILETSSPNDENENFLNAHIEAATEGIPTKQRSKHRVPWET